MSEERSTVCALAVPATRRYIRHGKAKHLLKTLLEELGLQTFIKTTGGKGLHVVVPIKPGFEWDEIKAFTKSVAELMVRSFPDRFVATVTKSKRHGKIFVDYLRNADGATAIAP